MHYASKESLDILQTFKNLINAIKMIGGCQAYLPVQHDSNIYSSVVIERKRVTPDSRVQNKPLVASWATRVPHFRFTLQNR